MAKEATKPMEAVKKPLARGLLKTIASRTGGDTIGSMKGVPRRRVTFPMPAESCAPGLFDDDFEITVESLSSRVELEAAKKAKADPASISMWFAYYSIVAVNGEPLDDGAGERDLFWEALGTSGRQIVMGVFAQTCMGDLASMGKAMAGVRIE